MLLKIIQSRKSFLFFLLFTQLYYISLCFTMKYKSCNFEPCEQCDEDSKVFYKLKSIQLCPRCTLEHLSFYFSFQSKQAVKFYITDILFNHLNQHDPTWVVYNQANYDQTLLRNHQKASWITISTVLNHKLQIENSSLEQRRKENDTCNLFVIANEILTNSFNQKNLLKRRECSKCFKNRFNLIKVFCCKKFICLSCVLYVQKRKCIMCREEMYPKSKDDLYAILNITCYTAIKAIRKNVDRDLMRRAIQTKTVWSEKPPFDTLKNQVEQILKFYVGPKMLFPWKSILEPESAALTIYNMSGFSTKYRKYALAAFQTFLLSNTYPEYDIPTNFVLVCAQNMACMLILDMEYEKLVHKPISEIDKKIHLLAYEIEKVVMILLSFFVLWFTRNDRYSYLKLITLVIPFAMVNGTLTREFLKEKFNTLTKYDFF